jgi:Mce-associated membrane protein
MMPPVSSDAPPRPRDDDESVPGTERDRAERTDALDPADRADTLDEGILAEDARAEDAPDETARDVTARDVTARDEDAPEEEAPEEDTADELAGRRRSRRLRRADRAADGADADDDGDDRRRSAPSLPLVPALLALLALLLGAVAFLWFTRPVPSSVSTDYAAVLAQARSQVVDMTSFDYLTLDDDIEQIRRVTTGDLQQESVDRLDSQRQALTDGQVIANTEVIAAGVTQADADDATVMLVLQLTQESAAAEQPEVSKYRVEVTLVKEDGRWLLSGLTGR